MEAMYWMLMNFMSKVMGAVETRHHDGSKRTKDEGFGIRSFASLGRWINQNKEAVKAAIVNDSEVFMLIIKQANETLKTYIKTGVWNKLYWIISDEGYFSEDSPYKINLKVHFVWTPQNGQKMTKDEDNRFLGKMKNVAYSLQKAGYDVQCPNWTSITQNAEGCVKYVGYSSGNVFELMEDFLGRQSREIKKLVWQASMEDKLQHE